VQTPSGESSISSLLDSCSKTCKEIVVATGTKVVARQSIGAPIPRHHADDVERGYEETPEKTHPKPLKSDSVLFQNEFAHDSGAAVEVAASRSEGCNDLVSADALQMCVVSQVDQK
jgi:hypothetical protein